MIGDNKSITSESEPDQVTVHCLLEANMNRWVNILVIALVVSCCFYAGGVGGYFLGFFDGLVHGGLQSSTVVVTLRDLRASKVKESIKRLEGNLYGNISNFAISHDHLRPFDVLGLSGAKSAAPWIVLVRDYYKQYPSSLSAPTNEIFSHDGENQFEMIDRTLTKYGQEMDSMRREYQTQRMTLAGSEAERP